MTRRSRPASGPTRPSPKVRRGCRRAVADGIRLAGLDERGPPPARQERLVVLWREGRGQSAGRREGDRGPDHLVRDDADAGRRGGRKDLVREVIVATATAEQAEGHRRRDRAGRRDERRGEAECREGRAADPTMARTLATGPQALPLPPRPDPFPGLSARPGRLTRSVRTRAAGAGRDRPEDGRGERRWAGSGGRLARWHSDACRCDLHRSFGSGVAATVGLAVVVGPGWSRRDGASRWPGRRLGGRAWRRCRRSVSGSAWASRSAWGSASGSAWASGSDRAVPPILTVPGVERRLAVILAPSGQDDRVRPDVTVPDQRNVTPWPQSPSAPRIVNCWSPTLAVTRSARAPVVVPVDDGDDDRWSSGSPMRGATDAPDSFVALGAADMGAAKTASMSCHHGRGRDPRPRSVRCPSTVPDEHEISLPARAITRCEIEDVRRAGGRAMVRGSRSGEPSGDRRTVLRTVSGAPCHRHATGPVGSGRAGGPTAAVDDPECSWPRLNGRPYGVSYAADHPIPTPTASPDHWSSGPCWEAASSRPV